jgi:hypothetical protein
MRGRLYRSYSQSDGTSLFDWLSTTAYAATEHWTDGLTSDTSVTYSGGTGTSEDPFILKTAQDLAQLSVNVSPSSTYSNGRYFKLDEDVDLSGKLWTPIAGNPDGYHNGFSGNFNENGHRETKPDGHHYPFQNGTSSIPLDEKIIS